MGFPVADDRRLFEKLSLEGFQSGLSWRTILAKRENFRAAFAGFDISQVARYGERDFEFLLQDAGIIRHRGKIEAVINNARCAEAMLDREGSLAAFVWRYEPDPAEVPEPQTVSTSPIGRYPRQQARGRSLAAAVRCLAAEASPPARSDV